MYADQLLAENELRRNFFDCSNVIADVRKTTPDVVLMDIDMPNVNGIEGVKLIRMNFPKVQVLMQTVFEDDDKIFASICAGASGYILKSLHLPSYYRQWKMCTMATLP